MGRRLFRGTKSPLEPDFDGVHDMTPARFDILHIVSSRYRDVRVCPRADRADMADVRKALGLHPSTMTVAVRRLVELGLITVERHDRDRRKVVLVLTNEGRARIRQAYRLVWTGRAIARHYRSFFARRTPAQPNMPSAVEHEMDEFWFYDLVDLGRHVGDRAELVYAFRVEEDH